MKKKAITLVAVIVVFAIIGAGFCFWKSQRTDNFPSDASGTAPDFVTAGKKPTASEEDDLSDWKTYTNLEAGFAFKYPGYFKDLNFGKAGLATGEIVSYSQPFFFSIIQKNQQFSYFNQVSVDPDWNRDEFAANMGISEDGFKIYFVKKLNSKSVLVAYDHCIEGSGWFSLDVFTPISNNYPNFVISIGLPFSEDSLIKNYEKYLEENGLYDECKIEPYGQIAQKIEDGTYSDKLSAYIETARQIVDSITLLNNENISLKTYSSFEADASFKYPADWEVKHETQYKSAACQVDRKCKGITTVYLNKADDSRSWQEMEKYKFGIVVNQPQCSGVEGISQFDLPGGNWLCVYGNDQKTLDTAKMIINTFNVLRGDLNTGIENGEYYSSIDNVKKKITLKNGEYYIEPDAAKTSFGIRFSIEKYAIGDLNGDGKNDAAVILNSINEGGSIPVYDLNILNSQGNGLLWQDSSEFEYGSQIKSINIQNGKININAVIPGPNEMPCCPTFEKNIQYELSGGRIIATKNQS